MLVTLIANNWFINILAAFFISLLDTVAYSLLAGGYNIFYAVSQIDIFGTDGGETIYTEITSKIYTALSVVMVFVFAYYLIMMIIDPDGGKGKSTSALVKETIIAFITVILLPTVFRYMSVFQTHVITDNTIGNLILGGSGGSNGDFGDTVALIVFTSFYHPEGTAYSDYFDNDGELKSDRVSICTNGGANQKICEVWSDALEEWKENKALTAVGPISRKSKLYNATNDEGGMYYMWVITTVCGVVCAWFFFSYAIDVGTRCVKLAFLQLIAPIPVLLKIFPQGKKTFDSWFAEIKKSYLEIFLRLAIIFFIVKLCTMVPLFIDFSFSKGFGGAIGDSTNSITSNNVFTRALATVCLILGLLKFAKDAPQLFKTIFASGGGLFAGLDWKPGMKRRVNENEYAMKGMAAGMGAIGGIGSSWMAGKNAFKRANVEGDVGAFGAGMYAAWSGLRNIPRGVISGAKAGLKNAPTEFSAKNLAKSAGQGLSAAQASDVRRQAKVDERGHMFISGKWYKNIADNVGESIEGTLKAIDGQKITPQLAQAVSNITGHMDQFLGNASVKKAKDDIDNKYADGLKKMRDDAEAVWEDYDGVKYNRNGTGSYLQKKKVTGSVTDWLLDTQGFTKTKNSSGIDIYKRNSDGVELTLQDVWDWYGTDNKTYDKDFEVKYKSMSDLKNKIADEKNTKIASMANKEFQAGAAQVFANALKEYSNNKQLFQPKDIQNMQSKLSEALGTAPDKTPSVEEFLKNMSMISDNKTAEDIKALNSLKTEMTNIMKNAEMVNAANEAKKNQEKQNDSSKDKK